jgi:hypothetical protein
MGFALVAWLVMLYLSAASPAGLRAAASSSLIGSSSQDAEEHEPRQLTAGGARCVLDARLSRCCRPGEGAFVMGHLRAFTSSTVICGSGR